MNQSPDKPNPSPSSIPMEHPCYPIWGRLFMCRIPRIAFYDTKYLEHYGLHTSGNQQVDRELAKQPQLVYITINDMVEYYHSSQRIAIVKQEDVKTVYEICQNYTFDIAENLNRRVFSQSVPFADLVKIDEFAEAVYQHAGYEYGSDFARTFLPASVMENAQSLHKMFEAIDKRSQERNKQKEDQLTVNNRYSPKARQRAEEQVKLDQNQVKLPERPSMRDLFLSYMDRSGVSGRV